MDRFDTWLWNQNASRHYTTIYMRCSRSQDKSKIVVRLADSNRKDPENASLDPDVRRLMEDTVTPLFQTCAFEDGKGVKMPQQDSFNNCLFHSILYQNSFIAGVNLNTVRIHQEAAQLRCYTVLLLREEMRWKGGGGLFTVFERSLHAVEIRETTSVEKFSLPRTRPRDPRVRNQPG